MERSGEVILYRSDDGRATVQLHAVEGTVWLTQAQMADLYDTSVPNIAQIIRRILADGEVSEATINSELTVRIEGTRQVRRQVKVYNLDMVLAVGYRVTTPRAVQFRQWASTVLKEHLVKGFSLDDDRLQDPSADYFDELLERIRAIRASEKRFYQKVRDLFATASADYDGRSEAARTFYATIQNKLIFAVTGETAAELIVHRADPDSPTLGLQTWKGTRVRKADAMVAKNYLGENEIDELNRLTTMFLDFAEDRARRRQPTLMAEWALQTDRFLRFNERGVLADAGRVSAEQMEEVTAVRYEEFEARRRAGERARAEQQELDDLSTLTALERRRVDPRPRESTDSDPSQT